MPCRAIHLFNDLVIEMTRLRLTMSRSVSETTFTDIFLTLFAQAAQLRPSSPNVFLDYGGTESVTGADMEWNIVDTRTGESFRFFVQAKSSFRERGNGSLISNHSYSHLDHKVKNRMPNAATQYLYQINQLIRHSNSQNAYPLYIFYNKFIPLIRGQYNPFEGSNVASAHMVKNILGDPQDCDENLPRRVLYVERFQNTVLPTRILFCPLAPGTSHPRQIYDMISRIHQGRDVSEKPDGFSESIRPEIERRIMDERKIIINTESENNLSARNRIILLY